MHHGAFSPLLRWRSDPVQTQAQENNKKPTLSPNQVFLFRQFQRGCRALPRKLPRILYEGYLDG